MSELALQLIEENRRQHDIGDPACKKLELGCCGLTEIPDEVFKLVWLEELILSNTWEGFEDGKWLINQSSNDEELNKFSKIPKELLNLQHLKKLRIGGWWNNDRWQIKKLENLPSGMTHLYLSFNEIEDIHFLGLLSDLQSLDLRNNQITDYSLLEKMTNLQNLYLDPYQINDYSFFEKLQGLQSLYFSTNEIRSSGFLENLASLKNIYLHSNEPLGIHFSKKLRGLQNIYISSDIIDISLSDNLRGLNSLYLSSDQIIDIHFLEKLTGLQRLYLSSNQIIDIHLIEKLTSLRSLYLRSNQINAIRFLNKLKRLRKLFLSSNQVSDFSIIGNLIGLRSLGISVHEIKNTRWEENFIGLQLFDECKKNNNEIHFLGKLFASQVEPYKSNGFNSYGFLENFKSLRTLTINHKQISNINFLEKLSGLQSLDLSYNQISDIRFLEKLTNLQSLDLSSNRINDIRFLEKLTNLQSLVLSHNKISNLTPIRDLIVDKAVDVNWDNIGPGILVQDNPLIDPPAEIVKKGRESVVNWFKEIENKETIRSNEVKLILVGNSTSGKTSLSLFLRKEEYSKTQSTTHGAELMHAWKLDDGDLTINIWDFGGQEYYHSTHNLFMGDRAVYAVVWDEKTNHSGFLKTSVYYDDNIPVEEDLEHFHYGYWLSNIRHHSNASSILMVCNKCELCENSGLRIGDPMVAAYKLGPGDFEYNLSIEEAYMHLQSPSKDGKKEWYTKFELFQTRLIQMLQQASSDFLLPRYWTDVKQEIMEMFDTEAYEISMKDFKRLCLKYDKTPDLNNAIVYLRDISGIVLHYPDNALLKNRLFINPNNINNLIYKILDLQVKNDLGKFTLSHVIRKFDGKKKQAETFIEIMKELGLVFEDNTTPDIFIAPQYLPHSYHDEKALGQAMRYSSLSLVFVMRFPEFLPRSVIAQFITKNGFAASDEMYWKFGILFKKKSLSAMVICSFEGVSEIKVEVQQGDEHGRIALIRDIFYNFWDILNEKPDFELSLDGEEYYPYQKILESQRQEARYVVHGEKQIELQKFYNFKHKTSEDRNIKIFISYSKTNIEGCENLVKIIRGIRSKEYEIETWYDHHLVPTKNTDESIRNKIVDCTIFICLVTHDFLSTDYIWDKELPIAKLHNKPILPIIFDDCDWENKDYPEINQQVVLPTKGEYVLSGKWNTEAEAWKNVKLGIRRLIEQL